MVDRVYQQIQQITDNQKVLMEYLDPVVEEVAEVTVHHQEEMVDLVLLQFVIKLHLSLLKKQLGDL